MIEINANPHRLDLDATHCRRARALGVTIVDQPRRPLDRRPGRPRLRRRRGPAGGSRPGGRVQHGARWPRSPRRLERVAEVADLIENHDVCRVADPCGGSLQSYNFEGSEVRWARAGPDSVGGRDDPNAVDRPVRLHRDASRLALGRSTNSMFVLPWLIPAPSHLDFIIAGSQFDIAVGRNAGLVRMIDSNRNSGWRGHDPERDFGGQRFHPPYSRRQNDDRDGSDRNCIGRKGLSLALRRTLR